MTWQEKTTDVPAAQLARVMGDYRDGTSRHNGLGEGVAPTSVVSAAQDNPPTLYTVTATYEA